MIYDRGLVYFKSLVFIALSLIVITVVSSCAATATKNELSPIQELRIIENKKSITFRFYFKTILKDDRGVRIYWDESLSKQIGNLLVQSGQFKEVKEYQQDSSYIRDANTVEQEKQITKVNFPVETDLFLDIQAEGKDYGPHAYAYWGMVHILSLGLIPMYINADINWSTILYDKNGVALAKVSVSDKSSIWAWSPLFFFNGFHMFPNINDVAAPMNGNALNHVLKGSEAQLRK